MKTILQAGAKRYVLEDFLSPSRTLITVGRASDEAYNVIAIDDAEAGLFQCQLSRSGDKWQIRHGQLRTECPRGIRSRLQHACSMCMGRCVNPRTAQPAYSWRFSENPTWLNGSQVPDEGATLKAGDTLSFGNTTIKISME